MKIRAISKDANEITDIAVNAQQHKTVGYWNVILGK